MDGALKLGFSESFWAIFDGNITTLIVAVMLMGVFGPSNILSIIFGESTTGAIFSFGFTLLVGIIGNFIMGMTATRLMTLSLAGFKGLHSKNGCLEVRAAMNEKTYRFHFTRIERFTLPFPLWCWWWAFWPASSSGPSWTSSCRRLYDPLPP